MKASSITMLRATALIGASLLALSEAAFGQSIGLPPVKQSKGDTWQMSCAEARGLVKGSGGTLLRSGPNFIDLYHVGGGTCHRLFEDMQAALVRTKDNPWCFIGYTCIPSQKDTHN